MPLSPLTGKAASSTAPDTWAPLDAALRMTRAARFQPPQGGVGLVSAAVPDLVFLDLDRCLNPLHPDAARLLEACPTYSEITQSGNGARIIGRASEISATISRKGTTAGGMAVEIYRAVRRQRLWDQIGDFNNGGFLAHRNPKESEDEPEILRPTHAGAS
ncbi:MAG: hypothetical protein ING08_21220 [Roseomonas sp.]|nr:hypothetical protein [Roseomonas sp.]MCA3382750.1 hypothetical protein [Roseomonas sp.]